MPSGWLIRLHFATRRQGADVATRDAAIEAAEIFAAGYSPEAGVAVLAGLMPCRAAADVDFSPSRASFRHIADSSPR